MLALLIALPMVGLLVRTHGYDRVTLAGNHARVVGRRPLTGSEHDPNGLFRLLNMPIIL